MRALARIGIIVPQRGPRNQYQFSFQDIVLLRTASSLRRAHVPQTRMQEAFDCLKKQLPPDAPLSGLQIETRGEHIVVSDGDRAWDVETDQLQLDFPVHRGVMRQLRSSLDPSADAEAWYQRGVELESSAPEEARVAYERAVDLDLTHADAQVNLGRLLHHRGMIAEAAERYRMALLHSVHATAAFNLGIALEDMKCSAEAVQAYRAAITMDPTLADAHYNLSRIYEANGDLISAINHLKAYRSLRRSQLH